MKTILLIRLACYISMAKHSQPGTSLRFPKLWFICVKHVINDAVQPLRRHISTKLVSLISRSVSSMCRKFGKDCPISCWNMNELLYLFWNQEVSSAGRQTTADNSLGACKENLLKSLIKEQWSWKYTVLFKTLASTWKRQFMHSLIGKLWKITIINPCRT